MLTSLLAQCAHYCLLPPVNFLLLALAGLCLKRWRPQLGRAVTGGALLALLVVSTSFIGMALLRPLEEAYPPLDMALATSAQAIVVLSAGTVDGAPEYGGRAIPDHLALPRVHYGAHVQHATGLPVLVSGGGNSDLRDGVTHADAIAAALREDFRTPVRWLERASTTTAENATMSAAILQPQGIRRIILVTHAVHMERARMAFAQAGFDVIPAPTAYFSRYPFHPRQLLPSASGLYLSYYATYEWVGLAWYRLKKP